MCDVDYTVIFINHAVTIYSTIRNLIIKGWSEADAPYIWCMYLLPTSAGTPQLSSPDVHKTSLQAFIAYDLPSVEALVRYFHAASGLPVCGTWLKDIKSGNFTYWLGLTYHNYAKYYPTTNKTLKGHMVQLRQCVRSTNPKPSRFK